jgi:hypothetical protein
MNEPRAAKTRPNHPQKRYGNRRCLGSVRYVSVNDVHLTMRIPMQLFGYAQELVGAVVMLASDAASCITGHWLIDRTAVRPIVVARLRKSFPMLYSTRKKGESGCVSSA